MECCLVYFWPITNYSKLYIVCLTYVYLMTTTIQISEELQDELVKRKFFERETYEEVIWDMVEDTRELNEQTKKEIAEARAEIKARKVHKLSKVKKELGL